ncbi:MAG TPA: HK97 family phage prohead protease [Vicinamibacterales bacterium]|nr:HK97 family phage prohead protease [Vicinamibacterales bacterium]
MQAVDLLPLCLRADVASVNDEARTVDLIFSTGAAVDRMDWWTGKRYIEKLSLDSKAIRIDRLNAGGPLLDSHAAFSVEDQLGAVVPGSVRLTKTEARATVKFSRRERVEPIWQDVREGLIRSVSVGYRVFKFEEDAGKDNKIPIRTATDWEPYEVSMVSMPADAGAKVRAGDKSNTNHCVIVTRCDDADRVRRLRLARASY